MVALRAPNIAIEEWVRDGPGHNDLAEATPPEVDFARLSPGCCVDVGCRGKIAWRGHPSNRGDGAYQVCIRGHKCL